jgi:hypothetical protein
MQDARARLRLAESGDQSDDLMRRPGQGGLAANASEKADVELCGAIGRDSTQCSQSGGVRDRQVRNRSGPSQPDLLLPGQK